ncbi:putative KHG-aldolase [Aspergillus californicus]
MTQSNGHQSANGDALKPGIYVPTIAFFDANDAVDIETTAKHAVRLAKSGVAGLVTHGSNGEAVHLTHDERMLINQTTRNALDAAGFTNLPLIVGCGAQSTLETIQLCKEAAQTGGAYTLVLPPAYYGSLLSNEAIMQHFRDVADASPIPVLIYNFPGACSGLDLSSDVILSLAEHPNIVGVKLTCGNTGKLARVASQARPSFRTMGGSVDFTLQTLVVGGHGIIGGLANICPRACVKVMELYNEGKVAEAREVQAIVARADWVAIKGGFIAVKGALNAFYGYGGLPRKPCRGVEGEKLAQLEADFNEGVQLERELEKLSG